MDEKRCENAPFFHFVCGILTRGIKSFSGQTQLVEKIEL